LEKNKGKKIAIFLAISVFAFAVIAKIRASLGAAAFAENKDKSFYTVLVCGEDTGGRNTDVMMLASLDLEGGKMNILQIPRDTFVNPKTSGLGVTRINAVYSAEYARAEKKGTEREKEAMAGLCRFLSGALNAEIDRYVLMDTAAFSRAVDAVGGIEYAVPAEMHYDDPVQGLHIHLDKGRQTLDGKKAEGLLRYRSGYAAGDLGRVDVRSAFLRELLSQVKEKMTAGAAARLAAELAFSVTTDMSIYEISRFAAFLHGIAEENVNIKTLSGSAVENP
jgi:LCP family protein required for cell wall assembly